MNFKKSALASAITLATFATTAAAFDASSWEVSGFVKNETAALQKDGTFIGQRTSMIDTGDKNDSGDVIKFENTAKVFVNGDLTENAALHAELNFVYDTEATPNDYQGHMNYSQNDYLRELYVDTMVDDTEVRVGKQQVVWGTADGIKLLDIINPTDYREFVQNTMEDARIPIWMAKADLPVGDSGGFQFILSQSGSNKIAGLGVASAKGTAHTNGDQGSPFIMKGVDTLTGDVNGFLNVSPALGKVAYSFSNDAGGVGTQLAGAYGYTVSGFTQDNAGNFKYFCQGAVADANCLYGIANGTGNPVDPTAFGFAANTGGQDGYAHNLIDEADASWDPENANSMFEMMPSATFATFDTFVGMTSEYRVEKADDKANYGFRYRGSTDGGTNYSFNYFNHLDSNPYVELHYEKQDGTRLYEKAGSGNFSSSVELCETDATCSSVVGGAAGYTTGVDTTDSSYAANLVMTEKHKRINSFGASFDTTFDTDSDIGAVVIRGEFLYDKDVMTPVITRNASDNVDLSHGFFVNSFTPTETDFLKYVIGADVTLLTNMLVSGQFIQFRNLDYVDEGGYGLTTWKYTADSAAMHLTNNLKKARENQEYYSLFLSKPFGPNQLGRWNNILMLEEGGGRWNRFDVEYSFSDELVGSFELNNYWGDENTQFGQMEDASNIQVGLKYLF
jgi:hypothetical protein